MKAFLTGGSGFIGFHVAAALIKRGTGVKALVRDKTLAPSRELARIGAELVTGDVRDIDSVIGGMSGCGLVFHLAADYRLWAPNPEDMYQTNVEGTVNVLSAALAEKVEKVVYTSSVGALAASSDGTPVNEDTPVRFKDMCGHYKKSKFLAEREAENFFKIGLPVVIVNPSTPIGAMDRKPTPTGRMIVDFLNGRMPAYLDTGLNFVGVKDVAEGHILAMKSGKPGQKYILGNSNLTLKEFFALVGRIAGMEPPRVRLPYLPVLAAAYLNEAVSRITRKPPLIPLAGVKMARKYMFYDNSRAVRELGFNPAPVERELEDAIIWFRENGYIKKKNGFKSERPVEAR
ncbi:MAG: NAD-dependent epimerase/dehydratase family protein [Actinomycetota bacterium]|nr:NAD-dependent epimerase/dehydratase family protein [Actinomycetota bacterium]